MLRQGAVGRPGAPWGLEGEARRRSPGVPHPPEEGGGVLLMIGVPPAVFIHPTAYLLSPGLRICSAFHFALEASICFPMGFRSCMKPGIGQAKQIGSVACEAHSPAQTILHVR